MKSNEVVSRVWYLASYYRAGCHFRYESSMYEACKNER